MNVNTVALTGALLFTTSMGLTAQNQPNGTNPKTTDYKLGQVWTNNEGITVMILAIEDVRKVGKVVHLRVDNIPWQSCGDIHLTRTVEHIAVTEKAFLNSGLVLAKGNVALPESSVEAYRKWQGQKKHEIAKTPLPAIIRAQSYVPEPMICNVLPGQT